MTEYLPLFKRYSAIYAANSIFKPKVLYNICVLSARKNFLSCPYKTIEFDHELSNVLLRDAGSIDIVLLGHDVERTALEFVIHSTQIHALHTHKEQRNPLHEYNASQRPKPRRYAGYNRQHDQRD